MPASLAGVMRAVATAAVVVAVDQIAKQIVVASIDRGASVAVFPGLDLTNTRNPGVAFGAFADGGALVAILIGLSLALLIGYFAAHASMPWLWLPVGLLVGGAIGNLVDRARLGSVVDYIDPVAWPAFNVADSCIVVGVLVLLFVVDRNQRRQADGSADAKPSPTDAPPSP
jgi:signal peptidase II